MKKLLVGAHTSIAGGVFNALLKGEEIGATTIQIFTSNQRQWKSCSISSNDVAKWKEVLQKTDISHIMSHDSYLINLGSSKEEMLEKSKTAFKHEIERCHLLEIPFLNFHPGSAVGYSEEECLNTIVNSLLSFEKLINEGPTKMVLETTAGQGTNVGYKFEQLAYIIERVNKKIPIGVCIDTCHIFCAGYDIRDKKSWLKILDEFDKVIGLNYLVGFHMNDSLKSFGSRRDRHANLGKGEIGIECFKFLMTHPKTKYLPKYLETPLGDKFWQDEIALLKKFGEQ